MSGDVRTELDADSITNGDLSRPRAARVIVNEDGHMATGDDGTDDGLAFKRIISGIRKQMGVTQATFGVLVGASKNSVYRWEKGEWLPSRPMQKHLLKMLEGKISKPTASALARAMLADPTQESGYVEPPPASPKDLAAARAALDARILAGAEALDLSPGKVRDVVADVLDAIDALGLDARTARGLVARASKRA